MIKNKVFILNMFLVVACVAAFFIWKNDDQEEKSVEILERTRDPILTLYTCTPKFTAFNRLVFKARLIQ